MRPTFAFMKTYLKNFAKSVVLLALMAAPMPGFSQSSGSGKPAPDLKGPPPRLPNGKPSFAGIWSTTRRANVTDKSIAGYVAELPYTTWGKRQFDIYDPNKNGDYAGSCLPFGFSRSLYGPHPTQIIQDNDYLVFLFEQNTMFYTVPTDGRGFTPDLPASWFGESIGRWDGDTLIVETRNMNGYTRIDTIGHPLSKEAKITQTYKRTNFGTIEHTFTVDDPKSYTRPFTITDTWGQEPWGTVLMEYACMESNIETLLNGGVTPWHPPADDDQE
jgi:hypothetical protein